MTEPLQRDDVIELLKRLGSDRDEVALDAARRLHAGISDAGMAWEDLLVSNLAAAGSVDVERPDGAEASHEPPAQAPDKHRDSLELIEELLADSEISQDLRDELDSYKQDIAEGEFEQADRRYLRALYERLSKRG